VLYLKSKAQCVWYWESFQAMSWPHKLMEATVVLPTVLAPVAVHLVSVDGTARASSV
jgi:hypothetical protein